MRPSARPLAWALLISLAIHLVALIVIPGIYALLVVMALVANPRKTAELRPAQNPPKEMVMQELPLVFVDVDPLLAAKEPPKNAKYYAAQNSQAANPDTRHQTEQPKIDGKQTHVVKTETVPPSRQFPLQPAPAEPTPEQKEEAKPKSTRPGDLAMAKPADKASEGEAPAPAHKRPRTLVEAEVQKQILGEKMKQDGGVRHPRIQTSLDARATPFGAYDAAFIRAVTRHWYDLVNNQSISLQRSGKVVLEFNLNYDGSISDMRVIDSNVDELMVYLCKRAILDPAKYEPWPSDMRRIIGSDHRDVTFTFYYD